MHDAQSRIFLHVKILLVGAASLVAAACSQNGGRVVGSTLDRGLPKPSRVLIYEFTAQGATIVLGRGLTRQPPEPRNPDSRRRQLAQEVASRFTYELSRKLKSRGIQVERVSRDVAIDDNDVVIDGRVTKIDEGNAFTRVAIGFGAGKSSVGCRIQLYQGAARRKLLEVTTHVDSGSLPGVATTLPAGAAIQGGLTAATLAGSAVSTGVDLAHTDVGRLAIANAHQGVQHLARFFALQGWIKPMDRQHANDASSAAQPRRN